MVEIAIINRIDYNIGDCLLSNNNNMIRMILFKKRKYMNTFIYNYCSAIQNRDKINSGQVISWQRQKSDYSLYAKSNIALAASIVLNMVNKFQILNNPPDKDTLVIHLRLGDVFNLSGTVFQYDYLLPNTKKLLEGISNTEKKKITIVTAAFHHGNPISKTDKFSKLKLTKNQYDELIGSSNDKSITYLTSFMEKIPKHFDVSIRSSKNIDADFLFLCLADELLLSGRSTFGIVAKEINNFLKNKNAI